MDDRMDGERMDNERIAKGLMADKLDGYLPERETGGRPVAVPRATVRARTSDVPPTVVRGVEPPLSRREWEDRVPALRTPHVLSEAKAHEVLVGIRASVREEGAEARFESKDWDALVGEVVGMMLDCAEGAGLVVKNRATAAVMRSTVSRMLREDMVFWGGDDRYRKVVVR